MFLSEGPWPVQGFVATKKKSIYRRDKEQNIKKRTDENRTDYIMQLRC